MPRRNHRPGLWTVITLVLTAVLVAGMALAQTALALPPRPTKPPPSAPPKRAIKGARLELQVQFPGTIPYAWQDLWTVVQWQDDKSVWHDVEGWQGTLDKVKDGVGIKTWWVGEDDLGKGPFRWCIYRGQGGWLMATSAAFDLPPGAKQKATVQILLGQ